MESNFNPNMWIREMIYERPKDLLKLFKNWRNEPPSKKDLKDIYKILKYYIFPTLGTVVGEINDCYSKLRGDEINDFSQKEGIKLLNLLIDFGLYPEFEIYPEYKKAALCYRHQEAFLNNFEWDSVILEKELILIIGNMKKELLYLLNNLDYHFKNVAVIFFRDRKEMIKFLTNNYYLVKNQVGEDKVEYQTSFIKVNDRKVFSIYCYKPYLKFTLTEEDDKWFIFCYQKQRIIAFKELIFYPSFFDLRKEVFKILYNF